MSNDKKLEIRNKIINAAEIYKDQLAGKYFMYVFAGKYIELYFKTSNFSHLTGVVTGLSGENFYNKAKRKQLNEGQFYFNKDHPFDLAKKKTNKLDRLPELTCTNAFIIEDMSSGSRIYKIGVTNLDFTLGLIENRDSKTNELIDDFLIPTTFRVRGRSDYNNNRNVYPIDFVLMKDSMFKQYDTVCYGDQAEISKLSKDILKLIDNNLISNNDDNNEVAFGKIEHKEITNTEQPEIKSE